MRPLAGVLALLALVLTGCGGTSDVGAGGADQVPSDAMIFVSIATDPDSSQWKQLDEVANRFPEKRKGVSAMKDALRDEGLDWERDVKPALGPEFDFVWLDLQNNGQDFVAITQPKDKAKFDKLMAKIKESSNDHLFRGRVGGWEVLAPSSEALARFRQASSSGDSKLTDNDAFNDAMSSTSEASLVRAYFNGPKIMQLGRHDLAPNEKTYIDKLGKLDWLAIAFGATSDGIRFDMKLHGKAGPGLRGVSPTRPFTPALQQRVPADALTYAAFHGAKGMLTGLGNNPLFKDSGLQKYSNVLRQVESLLQGENAFYLRQAPGKFPEVTFLSEPTAGTNGVATLDRIIARYRKELELPSQPKSSRVAGIPARTIDFGPANVYYAMVGKHFVITDSPAGIKTLKGNPRPLSKSQEYKAALDSSGMPAKTQGFLYVNIHGGLGYAQRLAGTPFPEQLTRNLRPLRSAVEYAATRPSELQVTFFLRIK